MQNNEFRPVETPALTRFMRPLHDLADDLTVQPNPHKGWYYHYYDNGLTAYGDRLSPGDFLTDFPGLHHIYLRLAWSYLEPREGVFDWAVLDDVIGPWTAHGYRIALRITCSETGGSDERQYQATPAWVREAGAQGGWYSHRDGARPCWEPDYADPVFLAKLDHFLAALANRYDGQPWMEYVDMGSYGNWGEGHTGFSSQRSWPADVLLQHVDMHLKHFKHTLVMVNDDLVTSHHDAAQGNELCRHLAARGVAVRDDSIGVDSYSVYGMSSIQCPEFFDEFSPFAPVDLEMEHYSQTKKCNTLEGGFRPVEAARRVGATYMGWHGYPRPWLQDNPALTHYLANRLGYWYFLTDAGLPDSLPAGGLGLLRLRVVNHGYARAYTPFTAELTLRSADRSLTLPCPDIRNTAWLPEQPCLVSASIRLPDDFPAGRYDVLFSLREGNRPIRLALKDSCRDDAGSYRLGSLNVV